MFCSDCGAQTSEASRFCAQCGSALAGAEASRPSYTPRHLVEAVRRRRSSLEGERKHVTVFFFDIVDSVELSAAVGPEQWHFALDGLFRILSDGVHRFEGTVNQYTGDGIMALFGAPVAHEDHVQRACYAALHIQQALRSYADELRRQLGIELRTRIGINSGEVVVGRIGDDMRMDYTAQGETVGLAARLQNAAAPGTILLSAHAAELASGFLVTEPLGALEFKGISKPVEVHRLLEIGSVENRFGQSRARGLSSFVGRDREVLQLERLFESVLNGDFMVAALTGSAGSGKTRLLYETSRLYEQGGARIVSARGFTHRQVVPLQSLADITRGLLGTDREADPLVVRAALEKASARYGMDLESVLGLIGDLLGVEHQGEPEEAELSPEASHRQLVGFVANLLVACAKSEPIVLIIEDLEWMDRATRSILAAAATSIRGQPAQLLVLLASRDTDVAKWFPTPIDETLRIQPLDDTAARALLDSLLGGDPGLAATRQSILDSTAGNPFFIEEVVRSLSQSGQLVGSPGARRLESPTTTVVVPETVQAVLSARIDRLHEDEKEVLNSASIVGSEFSESLLQKFLGMDLRQLTDSLHELVLADFIEEKGLYPQAMYRFKHPLTREVSYRMQLESVRRKAHGRLASTLTEIHGDQISRSAPLIAHHLESAGQSLDASLMWQTAAQGKVTSAAERERYWRRVLECARSAPSSPETEDLELASCSQLLSLAWTNGMPRETADMLLARGLEIVRGQPREAYAKMMLYLHFGRMLLTNESADAYCEYALRAAEACQSIDSEYVTRGVQSAIVHSFMYAGWPRYALQLADSILADISSTPPQELVGTSGFQADRRLYLRCQRCELRMSVGQWTEAEPELREIIFEAAERKQTLLLVLPRYTLARGHWLEEDGADLRPLTRESLELAHAIGSTSQIVMAHGCMGIAELLVGEYEAAVECLRAGLKVVDEESAGLELAPLLKTHLVAAFRGLGDTRAALAIAEEAVSEADARRFRFVHVQALFERGRTLLAVGRISEARENFSRATDLAREIGAAALEKRIQQALGA